MSLEKVALTNERPSEFYNQLDHQPLRALGYVALGVFTAVSTLFACDFVGMATDPKDSSSTFSYIDSMMQTGFMAGFAYLLYRDLRRTD